MIHSPWKINIYRYWVLQMCYQEIIFSGDIAVSGKTVHKLMKSSTSNTTFWQAYPNSDVDLWDQNFLNGEYIIAYEISPGLDHKIQNLLPEVR